MLTVTLHKLLRLILLVESVDYFLRITDGIQVDMRSMNKVELTTRDPYETSGPALRLGPGSTWGRVLALIPQQKYTMVHGVCTGVGVGGYLTGGGINYVGCLLYTSQSPRDS